MATIPRPVRRAFAWLLAEAALCLALYAGMAFAGRALAQEPVVPNFWDPKATAERPTAGSVTTIRFITTADFPPFNFLDASGRLTGFNIDLARAICKQLAAACTIQARPWTDLAAAVEEGRADAAIAGISISEETRKRLAFTDVYLRSPARFAVKRGGPALDISPEGLRGRSVAVVEKSAHEAYLGAFFPEAVRKTFANADAANLALHDGAVDAVFGDGIQLSFWLQGRTAENCCAFAGAPYLESRYFGQGYAIAVAQKSTDLRRAINAAMEDVFESGAYGELYLRYFPVSFY